MWVSNDSSDTLVRIDPSTNSVVQTIPIEARAYALALDGDSLWVTSFEDDAVIRVDTASGKVAERLSAPKPTGIAVGADGVWVVLHRADSVLRIVPATRKIVATIAYEGRGPDELCGRCIENVVVADGAVWTADSPRVLFELLESYRAAGLDDMIAAYLGERPAVSLRKFTLRRVPSDLAQADWHQDGAGRPVTCGSRSRPLNPRVRGHVGCGPTVGAGHGRRGDVLHRSS